MKENKYIFKFILFIVIIIITGIIFRRPIVTLFSHPDQLKDLILSFGILSPLIFIVFVVLQVLIAPISGQAAGFAGGYIFGTVLGTAYSMIGLIIGSYLAFILSRKFGRPFVERIINKKTLKKYDKILSSPHSIFTLFLIYLLPIFPDDAVCFIAGLTKIRIRTLVIISAFGRFPGFLVLNLVGDGVALSHSNFSWMIFSIAMIISFFLFLFRNRLENIMVNLIKKKKKITLIYQKKIKR